MLTRGSPMNVVAPGSSPITITIESAGANMRLTVRK